MSAHESGRATAPRSADLTDREQRTLGREVGLGIRDCLNTPNRPRRLALVLHLQGHTVPDAARVLGWPAKKTENLVYRGLSDLRSCLEGKGLKP